MPSDKEGRSSRTSRVRESKPGQWASSSQDFLYLANLLYSASARYAREADRNSSIYTLGGIPMLVGSLRCLLIELEAGGRISGGAAWLAAPTPVLSALANPGNEISTILDHYKVTTELRDRLELLRELRHEILHAAHRPTGDPTNTSGYLRPLRVAGLLQSTRRDVDYVWLAQLESHRLFRWALETVRDTVAVLVVPHRAKQARVDVLVGAYSGFESLDAAA